MAKNPDYLSWENEEKFQEFFQNVSDNIWVLDVDTLTFLYQSSAVEDIRGYTPEEAKALPLEKTVVPNLFPKLAAIIMSEVDRFKEGVQRTVTLETEVFCKDGGTVWIDIRARLFREGDKLRVLGISRDISARKLMEQEKEQLIGRLKEAVTEKDRLLAENKILRGLLPICSNCNKIRDESGQWHQLEDYITAHSEAQFTHTICPPCRAKLYPELEKKLNRTD